MFGVNGGGVGTANNAEKFVEMKAIFKALCLRPNGMLQPLSLFELFYFKNSHSKLESKIMASREFAEWFKDTLENADDDTKNRLLLQNFIVEQVSSLQRPTLSNILFKRDPVAPKTINGFVWLLAWVVLLSSDLFFLYYVFVWGANNGGLTFVDWCVNFVIVLVQNALLVQPLKVFVLEVCMMESLRPQLQAIQRTLSNIASSVEGAAVETKEIEEFNKNIHVVQHFSGACRVARSEQTYHLAASRILRHLDDGHIESLRHQRGGGASTSAYAVASIAAFVAVVLPFGDRILEIIIASAASGFALGNAYLLSLSPLLLCIPYFVIVALLLYHSWFLAGICQRALLLRERGRSTFAVASAIPVSGAGPSGPSKGAAQWGLSKRDPSRRSTVRSLGFGVLWLSRKGYELIYGCYSFVSSSFGYPVKPLHMTQREIRFRKQMALSETERQLVLERSGMAELTVEELSTLHDRGLGLDNHEFPSQNEIVSGRGLGVVGFLGDGFNSAGAFVYKMAHCGVALKSDWNAYVDGDSDSYGDSDGSDGDSPTRALLDHTLTDENGNLLKKQKPKDAYVMPPDEMEFGTVLFENVLDATLNSEFAIKTDGFEKVFELLLSAADPYETVQSKFENLIAVEDLRVMLDSESTWHKFCPGNVFFTREEVGECLDAFADWVFEKGSPAEVSCIEFAHWFVQFTKQVVRARGEVQHHRLPMVGRYLSRRSDIDESASSASASSSNWPLSFLGFRSARQTDDSLLGDFMSNSSTSSFGSLMSGLGRGSFGRRDPAAAAASRDWVKYETFGVDAPPRDADVRSPMHAQPLPVPFALKKAAPSDDSKPPTKTPTYIDKPSRGGAGGGDGAARGAVGGGAKSVRFVGRSADSGDSDSDSDSVLGLFYSGSSGGSSKSGDSVSVMQRSDHAFRPSARLVCRGCSHPLHFRGECPCQETLNKIMEAQSGGALLAQYQKQFQ